MTVIFTIIFLISSIIGIWLGDKDLELRKIGEYKKADSLTKWFYIIFVISFISIWGMVL